MDTGLLLGVRVLHHVYLGVGAKALDVGYLDEVVDALAIIFEVEARVLVGGGVFDDRLSHLVDLFLRRNLVNLVSKGRANQGSDLGCAL